MVFIYFFFFFSPICVAGTGQTHRRTSPITKTGLKRRSMFCCGVRPSRLENELWSWPNLQAWEEMANSSVDMLWRRQTLACCVSSAIVWVVEFLLFKEGFLLFSFFLVTGGVCLGFNILYLTIIPASLADFAITVNKRVLRFFLSLLDFNYWKLLIYLSLNVMYFSHWLESKVPITSMS